MTILLSPPLFSEDTEISLFTAHEMVIQDEVIEIDAAIPGIEGLPDSEFEKKMNDFLMERYLEIPERLARQARDNKAKIPEEEQKDYPPYWLVIDYQKRSCSPFLSFTVLVEYNTGGSTFSELDTYNIHPEESREIILGDLFSEEFDYVSAINAFIQQHVESREEGYFFEWEEDMNWLAAASGFYLENEKMVIVFPKYSIAPGSMGIPRFEISPEEFEEEYLSGLTD